MNLLLDIGNTRVKWCQWYDGMCHDSTSAVYQRPVDSDYWSTVFRVIERPDRVFACCVADKSLEISLAAWVAERWGVEVVFVASTDSACGVSNGYIYPAQLGVDRWAAIVAAYRMTGGAACVVDCGTAVTVDVVDHTGLHLGGLIIPGKQMMQAALVGKTAQVNGQIVVSNGQVLGNNTSACISRGAYQASLGMIHSVLEQYDGLLSKPYSCLITGGDAQDYLDALDGKCRYVPDLVLLGVAHLAGLQE